MFNAVFCVSASNAWFVIVILDISQSTKFPRHLSDKKSKITCKFFLDGNCMKVSIIKFRMTFKSSRSHLMKFFSYQGSDCLYSHDKSKIRERDICKSFKAMGFCSYGKKCRYIHLDIAKVGCDELKCDF